MALMHDDTRFFVSKYIPAKLCAHYYGQRREFYAEQLAEEFGFTNLPANRRAYFEFVSKGVNAWCRQLSDWV